METMVAIFGIGFLGHFLEGPTRRWFPQTPDGDDSVNRLMSYVEGGCLIIVAFALLAFGLLPRKRAWEAIALLCAAITGVGAGVAVGFIADGIIRK